jgi:putative ABC transport system ATP-binding protein
MLSFSDRGPYSFSLDGGCCAGLSGASGAGKTLLLRALADIDLSHGGVALNGRPRNNYQPHEWRRLVALVPAESRWWHPLVADHLTSAGEGGAIQDLVRACGFDVDILTWQVNRLSTGEKQRLSLVRALVREPAVLLLDEAGSGLDPDNELLIEKVVGTYLADHNSAAIWVSHSQEQLARVASMTMTLGAGELQIDGEQSCSSGRGRSGNG